MKLVAIIIMLLCVSVVYSQTNPYITESGNMVRIGNDNIERVISLKEGAVGTVEIVNKLSGKSYDVQSGEFDLQIVFAGFGPAYGKVQNGENPAHLTVKDFKYIDHTIDKQQDKVSLTLNFSFESYLTEFHLSVIYELNGNDFFTRKYIKIKDNGSGLQFLDRVYVENMKFVNPDYSDGEFGQPVLNNDLFLGVEYPGVENIISGENVKMGYVVGEKIDSTYFESFPSIIGTAKNNITLREQFLKYVDLIKVKGTRPFLLYNSWYDFRNQAIAEGPESIMNEKNVLHRIQTFKDIMFNKYHINLDAFVLDDGWDNYKSIWDIDTTELPHRFTPFLQPLKEMNTSLGIWASPFCGYSNRDIRVNWGAEHGYEKTGDFLCFAGKKYKAEFKKKMVEYTKKYNMGYFKWDGFLLACNELDHGHLPGIYSRTALISTFMDMMDSVRAINPDIFINITVGSWLSPWWLQYADCVWMQGEDYAYAEDVPSMNPRDKSITYRDAVLWQDFQDQKLLFPMSSLMTHGIIKGRLNFLGGKDESLSSFTNEVMMYFGRGVTMWELYVSPDLLSDGEWTAIASAYNWAKDNLDVLTKFKMILGNPLKREPYGYTHFTKDKGILILRNPYVDPKTVDIKLTRDLGELDAQKDYYVKVVYPYNYIYKETVKAGGTLKLNLDSYEVVTAELIPVDKIQKSLPVGKRFDISADGGITTYSAQKDLFTTADKKLATGNNKVEYNISVDTKDVMNVSTAAFLVEPDEKLEKELKPQFEIIVNGKKQECKIEEENGKWFWVYANLDKGNNKVQFVMNTTKEVHGKLQTWLSGDENMQETKLGERVEEEAKLPPKPYPANIKKVMQFIDKVNF